MSVKSNIQQETTVDINRRIIASYHIDLFSWSLICASFGNIFHLIQSWKLAMMWLKLPGPSFGHSATVNVIFLCWRMRSIEAANASWPPYRPSFPKSVGIKSTPRFSYDEYSIFTISRLTDCILMTHQCHLPFHFWSGITRHYFHGVLYGIVQFVKKIAKSL